MKLNYPAYSVDIKKHPRLQYKVKNRVGPFYIVLKKDELFMDGRCKFGKRENVWCAYSYHGAKANTDLGGKVRLLTFTDDLPLEEKDFQ